MQLVRKWEARISLAWAVIGWWLAIFIAAWAVDSPQLGDIDQDGIATVRDLARINSHINGSSPLPADLAVVADLNRDGAVNDVDVAELIQEILETRDPQSLPLATIRYASPAAGEGDVAITRETVLHFTVPLNLNATLTTQQFWAEFGGRKILSRVEISSDRNKATLFYLEPLPSNARIQVNLVADTLTDLLGRPMDLNGDGAAGGSYFQTFDTLSITPIAGTAITGRVFASERATGGAEVPLAGVTVTVDGAEETVRTVTDAQGNFTLSPCPAGSFFVHVDGRTSPASSWPNGDFYPAVGKRWEALAGRVDNLSGNSQDTARGTVYLPLIPGAALQTASQSQDTHVELPASIVAANPALAGTELSVPANSLFADDGTRGGRVGIAPVAPDRLPSPLPPGLNLPMVITIQTDGGTNFDRPVPVSFPNLSDPVTGEKLAPGAKSALWSFNHDLGDWEVVGPMTVTEDGNFVKTDVGVGVLQPGWHGQQPGFAVDLAPPLDCAEPRYLSNGGVSEGVACCGSAPLPPQKPTSGQADGPMCLAPDGCVIPPPSDLGSPNESLYREQFNCLRRRTCERFQAAPGELPKFPKWMFDYMAQLGYPSMNSECIPSIDDPDAGVLLCFTRLGAYHTKHELYPGFMEYAEILGRRPNPEAEFDRWDEEHGDFLQNVVKPCFRDLFPGDAFTAELMYLLVNAEVTLLRGWAQDKVRRKNLPILLVPPSFRQLVLPGSLTLASSSSAPVIGQKVKLSVFRRTANGALTDISKVSSGTRYALNQPTSVAEVDSNGEIHFKSSTFPLVQAPQIVQVTVRNGNEYGIAEFVVSDEDKDGDGLNDSWEVSVGLPVDSDAMVWDSDGDGLDDISEAIVGSSPLNADTDSDGIDDATEKAIGSGLLVPSRGRVFSSSAKLYFALTNLSNGNVIRGSSSSDRLLRNVSIAANSRFQLLLWDPISKKIADLRFTTSSGGGTARLTAPVFRISNDEDGDLDGLSNEIELVVGTNSNMRDSDGDGVSDLVELEVGTNPTSGLPVATGVLASARTSTSAIDVYAMNNIALVANGNSGITVFNVVNGLNPTRVAEINTPGFAQAVAAGGSYTTVADRDGGLTVIDIGDLSNIRIVHQVSISGDAVSVATDGVLAYVGRSTGHIVTVDLETGRVLNTLNLQGGGSVNDLAISGETLYVLQEHVLKLVPLDTPSFGVVSTLAVPGNGSGGHRVRVFAAGSQVYCTSGEGYCIVDASNRALPQIVQTVRDGQFGWKHFVLNGSGLGISAADANSSGPADVNLYDVGADGRGTAFQTRFETPGSARAISIYNGLAYVADGSAGLQVINYLAYDALGQAPDIELSSNIDLDSGTAEEGKRLRLTASVTDDVQVRNVEFYVDGQLAVTDGSFPFEYAFITADRTAEKTQFTLQAKATDTGGNLSWTPIYNMTLILDATPPVVNMFSIAPNQLVGSISEVHIQFSEPMNVASLSSGLSVTGAGADGQFGTADDMPVSLMVSYRESSNLAFLNFNQTLMAGTYRINVGALVTDAAGNPFSSPSNVTFRVASFVDSDADGLADEWEPLLGLVVGNNDTDNDSILDGDEDFDQDGLSNGAEIAFNFDPRDTDSNDNGIFDGPEDLDLDGLTNAQEAAAGTRHDVADTDGDGWNDETEVTGGSNPILAASRPDRPRGAYSNPLGVSLLKPGAAASVPVQATGGHVGIQPANSVHVDTRP